jgi:hypothetical protein
MTAISSLLFVIELFAFIMVYNKAIKNRVDKTDLSDLKGYVDQQDRSIHHRVDGIENRLENGMTRLQSDVTDILKILGGKK